MFHLEFLFQLNPRQSTPSLALLSPPERRRCGMQASHLTRQHDRDAQPSHFSLVTSAYAWRPTESDVLLCHLFLEKLFEECLHLGERELAFRSLCNIWLEDVDHALVDIEFDGTSRSLNGLKQADGIT